jgi:hypothetical protein
LTDQSGAKEIGAFKVGDCVQPRNGGWSGEISFIPNSTDDWEPMALVRKFVPGHPRNVLIPLRCLNEIPARCTSFYSISRGPFPPLVVQCDLAPHGPFGHRYRTGPEADYADICWGRA